MTPEQLKASILQYAIQGKLVEPNIRDCPVDLSAIEQKKTDDYEFELPDNWRLAHLESITKNIPSKQYQILESQVLTDGMFPVISQSKSYSIGFSNETEKVYHHDRPVIIFGDHTTEVKFVEFDFVVGADGVKIFEPNGDIITDKFLLYIFLFYSKDLSKIGGYSRHYKYIKNKPIPLPPLAEQKRIVAKIEELLPLVDRYAASYEKLEQFNAKFPEDMKKSILQYAIQGKLVEQRTEEGTGEELYQQIQAEKQRLIQEKKIKKEKPLAEISEDEIPFDIPESWKWVRFSELCSVLTCGYASTPTYVDKENGKPFISAKNIKPYKFMPEEHNYISCELYEKLTQNAKPEKGDILLTRVGAGIGEAAIIDVEWDFAIYVSLTLIKLVDVKLVNNQYILYWLNSPIGVSSAKKNIYGKNASQGNLNVKNVRDFLVPLPPLAEQKRIVAKIEELLPLCDRLRK